MAFESHNTEIYSVVAWLQREFLQRGRLETLRREHTATRAWANKHYDGKKRKRAADKENAAAAAKWATWER